MTHPRKLRFAAIGLDHRHIYDQVASLIGIGAECVGFWTRDEAVPLPGFVERFPHIPRRSRRQGRDVSCSRAHRSSVGNRR